MDRFRKYAESARTKWREFVNRNWHNQPEGDSFRLLDVVLLVGAIRSPKLTAKWQINCWRMYRLLAPFHFVMFVLNFIEHISGEHAFGEIVWHTTLLTSASICFAQHIILNRLYPSIQQARDFISSKPADSGDKLYDTAARKTTFKRTQFVAFSILLFATVDEALSFVPAFGLAKLYPAPQVIRSFGPMVASWAQFMITSLICPLWICKHTIGTALMCSLLFAFRKEFEIFTHGFDNIWNRVQLEVEENLPPTSTAAGEDQPANLRQRNAEREKLIWKSLNQHVINHVKNHVALLENLQSLKPAISWLFFVIYYYALLITSPGMYVMVLEGIWGTAAVILPCVICMYLECYWWCSLIESFQDINDALEISIMDLMAKLPYSKEHQADYAAMHRTLMIMKMNVRNSCQFSCGGMFNISVEVVAELLNISYSVYTFLRDFSKVYDR